MKTKNGPFAALILSTMLAACAILVEAGHTILAGSSPQLIAKARDILHELGAAIIVPRYPLKPGRYAVTATINDHAYQWWFTVAGAKGEAALREEAPAEVAPSHAGAVGASSKPPRKEEFEAALRAGYVRSAKADRESREEYERHPPAPSH